jgi:hypothetical protein
MPISLAKDPGFRRAVAARRFGNALQAARTAIQHARAHGSHLPAPPPGFRDGDRVQLANGVVWERQHGMWFEPGLPTGLTTDDRDMRDRWGPAQVRRHGVPTHIPAAQ